MSYFGRSEKSTETKLFGEVADLEAAAPIRSGCGFVLPRREVDLVVLLVHDVHVAVETRAYQDIKLGFE